MSSAHQNLSQYDESTLPSSEKLYIGIVVADWHKEITHALYTGCFDTLKKHGVPDGQIHTVQVPGTFELPVGARMLAQSKKVDAVICLGCVIKGETTHNEYINNSVAMALQTMSVSSGKPFVFGVLTPNTMEQAKDRAGGQYGNKGVEAAVTALRMAHLKKELTEKKTTIGF